jgi:peptidyl-prolyl cis-trans isomerase A (cyclophilin A)
MSWRRVIACAVAAAALSPLAAAGQPSLKDPRSLSETAPDLYTVRLDTSAGPIVIEVHREWAPLGADRFYNLVKNGFYENSRFFRVLPGFMAQGGIHADPAIQKVWARASFPDDKARQSNRRGYVTFASTSSRNSRSTQFFINYRNNVSLDDQGFAPFGLVVSGMEAVDRFYSYGSEDVPDQDRISDKGNAYLQREYPKLDFIKTATIGK